MTQNRTLPIYQLEAVMNTDNVYGLDELIGDPIHALEPQTQPPAKNQSFNFTWLLILPLILLIVFIIYKFKR